jgi:hypothetical protein
MTISQSLLAMDVSSSFADVLWDGHRTDTRHADLRIFRPDDYASNLQVPTKDP